MRIKNGATDRRGLRTAPELSRKEQLKLEAQLPFRADVRAHHVVVGAGLRIHRLPPTLKICPAERPTGTVHCSPPRASQFAVISGEKDR